MITMFLAVRHTQGHYAYQKAFHVGDLSSGQYIQTPLQGSDRDAGQDQNYHFKRPDKYELYNRYAPLTLHTLDASHFLRLKTNDFISLHSSLSGQDPQRGTPTAFSRVQILSHTPTIPSK